MTLVSTGVARLVLINCDVALPTQVRREMQAAVQELRDPLPVAFVGELHASVAHVPLPEPIFERLVAQSLKAPTRVWQSVLEGLLGFDDAAERSLRAGQGVKHLRDGTTRPRSRSAWGRRGWDEVCCGAGQSAAMPATDRGVIDRRRFLAAGGAVAAVLVADRLAGAWPAPVQRGGYPFALGVASGDPAPGGVVLWTRLAPQPLLADGGMPARVVPVDWQIAADPALGRIVAGGTVFAQPAQAHAVHVEVEGLEPARTYWYRFRAGGELSPVGRTRTLPAPGSSPGRLALAVVSCQHYEHGYYTAYQHLAQEDLDLVLHLGDYLYETAPSEGQPRRHTGPAPTDLASYRLRHALYRTDPDLQAAHAALPFVLTWDDHEVENDYAADQSERFDPPAAFLRRRAAAYQAYWEHLPLRRRRRPRGPAARLYRRLRFGDLAELSVLDTRQYRDDQPCDDNGVGRSQVVAGCQERLEPRRSLLGTDQRRWLLAGLDRSAARWNVIAQQLLMAELELQPGPGLAYGSDGWDGYVADRARILRFLQARRPSNPIVVGGDMHSFWVNDLTLDNHRPGAAVLASEFVGTSISSSGPLYELYRGYLPDNPHVRFFESRWRGYLRCVAEPRSWMTDLRVVDTVERPGAPVRTLASFVVEDGRPGPQHA